MPTMAKVPENANIKRMTTTPKLVPAKFDKALSPCSLSIRAKINTIGTTRNGSAARMNGFFNSSFIGLGSRQTGVEGLYKLYNAT